MTSPYYQARRRGVKKRLHVVIWEKFNGPVPTGYVVHHINFNKLDNRPENLTIMTRGAHTALHNKMRKQVKENPVEQKAPVTMDRKHKLFSLW